MFFCCGDSNGTCGRSPRHPSRGRQQQASLVRLRRDRWSGWVGNPPTAGSKSEAGRSDAHRASRDDQPRSAPARATAGAGFATFRLRAGTGGISGGRSGRPSSRQSERPIGWSVSRLGRSGARRAARPSNWPNHDTLNAAAIAASGSPASTGSTGLAEGVWNSYALLIFLWTLGLC